MGGENAKISISLLVTHQVLSWALGRLVESLSTLYDHSTFGFGTGSGAHCSLFH